MIKMFPTKNMMDYMTEMNRLFPRSENDMLRTNPYGMVQSPCNSTINRSSSSNDSTSPDSFPEISTFRPDFHLQTIPEPPRPMYETSPPMYEQRSMYETPPRIYEQRSLYDTPRPSENYLAKRQRPIVGRKILSSEPTQNYERVQVSPISVAKIPEENELSTSLWQEDPMFQHTPPNVNNYFIENKSYTNVFYELFPPENKGFEFKTPVKTSPTYSAVSNMSPVSNLSPPSMSLSPMGSNMYHSRSVTPSWPSSSRHDGINQKLCTFCRKNGETPIVYMTHSVKERVKNKFIVSCPILRSHVCSVCQATGDNAHTITYCPVLRNSNNGQPLQSTTVTLKNTRVKSNGRRRY